jgi:hypothetical protein
MSDPGAGRRAAGAPPGAECPDWRALAAARDASPGDPPGWEQALAHLDGCPGCRIAVADADPLLVFRWLPSPALAVDEVEQMRLRLAALRGAGRLAPRSRRRAVPQAAAAAVVALALLAGGNAPQRLGIAGPVSTVATSSPAVAAALAAEPLLEELDQPFDQVMQWNADDLSVVLVVDGRLGV